jgi:hypothetical protein
MGISKQEVVLMKRSLLTTFIVVGLLSAAKSQDIVRNAPQERHADREPKSGEAALQWIGRF